MENEMRRSSSRSILAALAAAILAAISPAVAQAAVTVGQSPPTGGALSGCSSLGGTLDIVQLANTSGTSYSVPAGGGVITSWRSSTTFGSALVSFRVYTGDASALTPVGESTAQVVTPMSPPFVTRISVTGGERLGYYFTSTSDFGGCLYGGNAAGDAIVFAVSRPVGQSELPSSTAANTLLNVSANVEADADKDGYGDETQDGCPSSAQTAGACGSPPGSTLPSVPADPFCARRTATIVGTEGPDRLRGTSGADVISAGSGDDLVIGRDRNDLICGGAGKDVLKGGTGRDKLRGDEDRDRLVGGGGKDSCNGGGAKDRTLRCERGPNH
ncbi:MAG: hypothetical protein ABIZ50_07120 [Solirubrobacterales bacterium]